VVEKYANEYLYLSCIHFIFTVISSFFFLPPPSSVRLKSGGFFHYENIMPFEARFSAAKIFIIAIKKFE
jgi:hypothetical protein